MITNVSIIVNIKAKNSYIIKAKNSYNMRFFFALHVL